MTTRIRHPEDIIRLREAIPEISLLPDLAIQEAYSRWSELNYAAGWLIMSDFIIEEFRKYLLIAPIDLILEKYVEGK